MSTLSKKATIYLDPDIHRALKIKAAATSTSISELIDNAIRHELALDEEDLRTFDDRASEPTVSFEKVLKDLKANGKV
ncbi:MAG: CopG family transcriptional regulator [Planctomycetes bacterium]|nr:CopG family transcriptional regulator [Planctomycetota bacterium]MCH8192828.1 CopG family transcriptional regulator [Planctomycetota bacterium]